MKQNSLSRFTRVLVILTSVLVLKVTGMILAEYRFYFPPDFNSNFLRGREGYFFDSYQWPFWLHILSGPLSLILGLLLVSSRFRLRFPKWHQRLGRIQAMNVLFFVAPSGFWMAFYAAAGPLAGLSFGLLSLLTATTMAMGWRRAVQRRFADHRRWMLRNFTLLWSAVVLRLIGGFATWMEFGPDWLNLLATWVCWVLPVLFLEAQLRIRTLKRVAHSLPAADGMVRLNASQL